MRILLLPVIVVLFCIASCSKSHVSQSPQISAISPGKGSAGILIHITGTSFDSVVNHITVDFNGIPGTVFQASDTAIVVIVPAAATTGKITVNVNGHVTTSSADFVILPGAWVQKASLPVPQTPNGRVAGISFSIGNFGYMGMGTDNGKDYDDLFAYDPSTDSWTQKASVGPGMENLVCMVINNKAYAGVGMSRQLGDYSRAFYEYDPVANTWTQKADFPGPPREAAMGLAIGTKGYVGFGYKAGSNSYADFWEYDPSTDAWTQKSDFPGITIPQFPVGFTPDNKLGFIGGSILNNPATTPWWQYDPSSDTWVQKSNFPGQAMIYPSAMVIGGTGYLLGGGEENWLYDPATDNWTQKAFFGNRVGGSTFVIGGTGYFGLGSGIPGNFHTDLWQYNPQ